LQSPEFKPQYCKKKKKKPKTPKETPKPTTTKNKKKKKTKQIKHKILTDMKAPKSYLYKTA
jgi:hypothetical protein